MIVCKLMGRLNVYDWDSFIIDSFSCRWKKLNVQGKDHVLEHVRVNKYFNGYFDPVGEV